jgi:hypothetical protein
LYAAEAAVELLIGHRRWLDRHDFTDGFVETGEGWSDGTPMAWVDWLGAVSALEAGRLPCSGSEAQVLKVAASIAEGVPVDLRGAVGGLDAANTVLVATSVLHAAGHHRHAAMPPAGVAGW